jgi:hypothetical protein
MTKSLIIRFFYTLTLCSLSFTCLASAASSATIVISPVTYTDDGYILFKTIRHFNYSGDATNLRYSYKWLVVSAKGTWEEVVHKVIQQPIEYIDNKESEKKQLKFWETLTQYSDEFKSEINWEHPPQSLIPLIKRYGFKAQKNFNITKVEGAVTWSSKSVCLHGVCSKKPVLQRTIGKVPSDGVHTKVEFKDEKLFRVEGPPLLSIFYHAGVALFHNGNYEIIDEKSEETESGRVGATFPFKESDEYGRFIDYEYFDGIAIVPREVVHAACQQNDPTCK